MFRLLRAGAAFFIIVGLFVIILSMLLPVVLAFGLGIGQGLAFVFGGLLLLALTQLISAVERVASALNRSVHVSRPVDFDDGRREPFATVAAAEEQPAQPRQQRQPQGQKPAAQQQPAQPRQQQKQPEQKPAAQQPAQSQQQQKQQEQQPAQPQQQQKSPEQKPTAQQQKPQEQGVEATEPQLHIVEERVIRGRPARILSDGTIEAELDEGWFRFENMEHLNEYLDALEAMRRQGLV